MRVHSHLFSSLPVKSTHFLSPLSLFLSFFLLPAIQFSFIHIHAFFLPSWFRNMIWNKKSTWRWRWGMEQPSYWLHVNIPRKVWKLQNHCLPPINEWLHTRNTCKKGNNNKYHKVLPQTVPKTSKFTFLNLSSSSLPHLFSLIFSFSPSFSLFLPHFLFFSLIFSS